MADASVIDLPATDRATLAAVMAWSHDVGERLTKSPAWQANMMNPFAAFGHGLPLRSTFIANNGTRGTSEFADVKSGDLSADLFKVPATYKEEKFDISNIGG